MTSYLKRCQYEEIFKTLAHRHAKRKNLLSVLPHPLPYWNFLRIRLDIRFADRPLGFWDAPPSQKIYCLIPWSVIQHKSDPRPTGSIILSPRRSKTLLSCASFVGAPPNRRKFTTTTGETSPALPSRPRSASEVKNRQANSDTRTDALFTSRDPPNISPIKYSVRQTGDKT
jgi:hypothetical protein